jgi:hypothetical protein
MTNYGILIHLYDTGMNHIGGVMVSMLGASVVDLGSSHGWVRQKTMKLVLVGSLLSTQH